MTKILNHIVVFPDKIPFDFDEVIAAIATRAFFSNSPLCGRNFNVKGVRKGIVSASAVYHFFGVDGKLGSLSG